MPTIRIGQNSTDDESGCTDVMIKQELPTTNFNGGSYPIEVTKYGTGDHTNSLIRFDLSSLSGMTITGARLGLYLYDYRVSGTNTVSVYRLLRNWVAGQATWNIYSTGNSWTTGGALGNGSDRNASAVGSLSVGIAAQYYEIDLNVADLQDAVDNPSANFGWMMERTDGADDTHARIFRASEGTDGQRPYLEVDYTEGGGGGGFQAAWARGSNIILGAGAP